MTILESIIKANAYFHLNLEHDKKGKRNFYNLKDYVVGNIISQGHEMIDKEFLGIGIHDDSVHKYVIVKLTDKENNITGVIHFPLEKLPESVVLPNDIFYKLMPYVKSIDAYRRVGVVTTDEYNEAIKNMECYASAVFRNEIMCMSDEEIIKRVDMTCRRYGQTITQTQYSTCGEDDMMVTNNVVIFHAIKEREHKHKRVRFYGTTVDNLIFAIIHNRSFSYRAIYSYLKTNLLLSPTYCVLDKVNNVWDVCSMTRKSIFK